MNDLAAVCASLGIETEYHDAMGRRVVVEAADLARIVAAFGPPPSAEPGSAAPQQAGPEACFNPRFVTEGRRLWLLAVQLYAVRSRRNWGFGDFTDLSALLDLAKSLGAAGIGLNPLHAMFLDRPEEASPYSPNSRLFLNPLYIDVDAVPDFPERERRAIEPLLGRLREADLVDYSGVAAVKLRALRAAHANFPPSGPRREDFEAFRRERDHQLERFAAFETLRDKFKGPPSGWPEEWRRPDDAKLAQLRASAGEAIEFHEYLQWIADRQLRACTARSRELGLSVGLYLDMAVGVDPGGADAWGNQDAVVGGLSIGAPPDILNPAGQNWGLASFNPRALAASDYQLLRMTLRALVTYAGAIRIDHVLGLNRFFLIPQGLGAQHGTYVRFPLQQMLAALAKESVAAECLVIGEDLGTVPDGLRETLAAWNVWSYRLMMFERNPDGSYKPPWAYPRSALVAFNTHDLPSFMGWMRDHDFRVKRALGIEPGETDDERSASRRELRAALRRENIEAGEEVTLLDVVRFLARTPSGLLAVAIDDVFGVLDQINVPGTVIEHPNWRRRWPVSLEYLPAHHGLRALADTLIAEGRGEG